MLFYVGSFIMDRLVLDILLYKYKILQVCQKHNHQYTWVKIQVIHPLVVLPLYFLVINKLILQWGKYTTNSTSGAFTLTPNIAVTPKIVIATVMGTTSSGGGMSGVYANVSGSNFILVKDYTNTNKGTAIYWLLIGY